MPGWTLGEMDSRPTSDPRIRIANFSAGKLGNWRTVVQDEPGPEWEVTGPPYRTMRDAEDAVPEVRAYYFGDEPTRAELIGRIDHALAIAREASTYRKTERMVAVLEGSPGAGHAAAVVIHEDELDVSTVRPGASLRGQGGQTTGEFDAYVRITHKPTGITVECDSERSQLMNKAAALTELRRQLGERAP